MTTIEKTRLEELKNSVQDCPQGCMMQVLGMSVMEEFLELLIKEEDK